MVWINCKTISVGSIHEDLGSPCCRVGNTIQVLFKYATVWIVTINTQWLSGCVLTSCLRGIAFDSADIGGGW